MLDDFNRWPAPPSDKWLTLVIISASLLGAILMCTFMFAIVFGFGPISFSSDTLTLAIALLGILVIPLAFVIPRRLIDAPSRHQVQMLMEDGKVTDSERLNATFNLFQSRMIFQFAILEGVAMANLMFFFMLGFRAINLMVFLLATLVFFAALPTRMKWYRWLDYMTR